MTNGEKIQKDFDCEVCEPIIEDDIIHVIFADKKDSAIGFDWSWWNSEYKEPTTKNDLGVDCVNMQAVDDALYNYWINIPIVDDSGYGVYEDSMDAIKKALPGVALKAESEG